MSAPPIDQALVDEAVEIVLAAGEHTLRWFRSDELAVERKADGTPVTLADKEAEALIRSRLDELYPDDAIVGEEEDDKAGTSGRTWIIDPIDGTKAFTHGVPLYTNLLAMNDEHGPAIGVINVPAIGETVWAGRGVGCFANGRPAHVSTRDRLIGSYLTTSGFDYWPEPMFAGVRGTGMQLRTWGDGYGYVLVATGRLEAMVDPVAAPWDLAPVPVIIAEAGGRFTDLAGEERIDGGNGCATNGILHDEILAALRGPAT